MKCEGLCSICACVCVSAGVSGMCVRVNAYTDYSGRGVNLPSAAVMYGTPNTKIFKTQKYYL